jgi:hypothetical protein
MNMTSNEVSTLANAVASGQWERSEECRFISTHCGCCGRALKDALSVEKGIGPDCRALYGDVTTTATAAPDWVSARTLIACFGATTFSPGVLGCDDARKVSAVLLHRFSRHFRTARWIPDAVYALGYHKLAERMAKRAKVRIGAAVAEQTRRASAPVAPVVTAPVVTAPVVKIWNAQVTSTYNRRTTTLEYLTVEAPFSKAFNAAVVGGRWFDRSIKAWRVPVGSKPALWAALRVAFAGLNLVTKNGTTVIA